MSYNYNRFKATKIFGNFQNSDQLDSSNNIVQQANATFDKDITLKGNIKDVSNNLIYQKINEMTNYVLNSSLTSTLTNYVLNSSLTSTLTNYVLNSSLTSTLTIFFLNSSLTSTLTNYALINSSTFPGVPSTTTPSNSSNNTTRIPSCEWVQSYFGNLSSSNTWSNTNNFTSMVQI
jgi:hypothetical protein